SACCRLNPADSKPEIYDHQLIPPIVSTKNNAHMTLIYQGVCGLTAKLRLEVFTLRSIFRKYWERSISSI
ncbi:MAG: hypothetical protein ABL858_01000, partial [Candidatus Nitrotoga sp.]